MRLHEIMGIEQNRRWGVCSLNDFRRFLGLKRTSDSRTKRIYANSFWLCSVFELHRVEL